MTKSFLDGVQIHPDYEAAARKRMQELEAAGDVTHDWWVWHGLECCKICGVVRRADRRNSVCKGIPKVGPR